MSLACPSCQRRLRKIAGLEGHFKCDEEGIIWKEGFKGCSGEIARYLVRVFPPNASGGIAEGPAMEIEPEPLSAKTVRIDLSQHRRKDGAKPQNKRQ